MHVQQNDCCLINGDFPKNGEIEKSICSYLGTRTATRQLRSEAHLVRVVSVLQL